MSVVLIWRELIYCDRSSLASFLSDWWTRLKPGVKHRPSLRVRLWSNLLIFSTIKLHALSFIRPSVLPLLMSLSPFCLPLSLLTVCIKVCSVYFFLHASLVYSVVCSWVTELVTGCAQERKEDAGKALRLSLCVSHTWTRAKTPQRAKPHLHSRFHADAPGTAASIWGKKMWSQSTVVHFQCLLRWNKVRQDDFYY